MKEETTINREGVETQNPLEGLFFKPLEDFLAQNKEVGKSHAVKENPALREQQIREEREYQKFVKEREEETLELIYEAFLKKGLIKPKKKKKNNKNNKKIAMPPKKANNVVKVNKDTPTIKNTDSTVNDRSLSELPTKALSETLPKEEKMPQPIKNQPTIVKRERKPEQVKPLAPKEDPDDALLKSLQSITIQEEEPEEIYEEEEEEALQAETPPDLASQLLSIGITGEMLAAWKKEYGESGVYMLVISQTECYVFTHLNRKTYKAVMSKQNELKQLLKTKPELEAELNEKIEESVVDRCLLFPRKIDVEKERAGLISALFSRIWERSLFLPPEQLQRLTITL